MTKATRKAIIKAIPRNDDGGDYHTKGRLVDILEPEFPDVPRREIQAVVASRWKE